VRVKWYIQEVVECNSSRPERTGEVMPWVRVICREAGEQELERALTQHAMGRNNCLSKPVVPHTMGCQSSSQSMQWRCAADVALRRYDDDTPLQSTLAPLPLCSMLSCQPSRCCGIVVSHLTVLTSFRDRDHALSGKCIVAPNGLGRCNGDPSALTVRLRVCDGYTLLQLLPIDKKKMTDRRQPTAMPATAHRWTKEPNDECG
jgi:hypothetical protein